MMDIDYKLLAALSAVLETQSFELAARKLFISQSAISQRIKLLEDNIGHPIVIRSQPIELTAVGEKLLSHYKKVQQLEHELLPEILPEQPSKPMKVSLAVNADSIATWFFSAITPVLKDHLIELNLLIEREEKTIDKLRSGEATGAVTLIAKPLKGYRAFKLGNMNYSLVASKSFQQRYFSHGVNASSLSMAPGITFDQRDDMHSRFIQQHFNVEASEYYCHCVRSSEAFVELTKQGVAYCLLPDLQIEQELASGELVKLCPDKPLNATLYWHSWTLVKGINKKISQEIIRVGRLLLS